MAFGNHLLHRFAGRRLPTIASRFPTSLGCDRFVAWGSARWAYFRNLKSGSKHLGCATVTARAALFSVLFWFWGLVGLLFNGGSLMGLTGSVGIGTSAYLTATSLIWIGGMVLFGIGALISHSDFDGERPLAPQADDIRISR